MSSTTMHPTREHTLGLSPSMLARLVEECETKSTPDNLFYIVIHRDGGIETEGSQPSGLEHISRQWRILTKEKRPPVAEIKIKLANGKETTIRVRGATPEIQKRFELQITALSNYVTLAETLQPLVDFVNPILNDEEASLAQAIKKAGSYPPIASGQDVIEFTMPDEPASDTSKERLLNTDKQLQDLKEKAEGFGKTLQKGFDELGTSRHTESLFTQIQELTKGLSDALTQLQTYMHQDAESLAGQESLTETHSAIILDIVQSVNQSLGKMQRYIPQATHTLLDLLREECAVVLEKLDNIENSQDKLPFSDIKMLTKTYTDLDTLHSHTNCLETPGEGNALHQFFQITMRTIMQGQAKIYDFVDRKRDELLAQITSANQDLDSLSSDDLQTRIAELESRLQSLEARFCDKLKEKYSNQDIKGGIKQLKELLTVKIRNELIRQEKEQFEMTILSIDISRDSSILSRSRIQRLEQICENIRKQDPSHDFETLQTTVNSLKADLEKKVSDDEAQKQKELQNKVLGLFAQDAEDHTLDTLLSNIDRLHRQVEDLSAEIACFKPFEYEGLTLENLEPLLSTYTQKLEKLRAESHQMQETHRSKVAKYHEIRGEITTPFSRKDQETIDASLAPRDFSRLADIEGTLVSMRLHLQSIKNEETKIRQAQEALWSDFAILLSNDQYIGKAPALVLSVSENTLVVREKTTLEKFSLGKKDFAEVNAFDGKLYVSADSKQSIEELIALSAKIDSPKSSRFIEAINGFVHGKK